MKAEMVKRMMDACYKAKRVRDMLPQLPDGVAPSYVQFLDAVQKLEKQNERVRVSDISDMLNLPRPGVTRTVKDMVEKGYLNKMASDEDGRVIYLTVTQKGMALSDKYDQKFFGMLSDVLSDISDDEALCTISTINKMYDAMNRGRIEIG